MIFVYCNYILIESRDIPELLVGLGGDLVFLTLRKFEFFIVSLILFPDSPVEGGVL